MSSPSSALKQSERLKDHLRKLTASAERFRVGQTKKDRETQQNKRAAQAEVNKTLYNLVYGTTGTKRSKTRSSPSKKRSSKSKTRSSSSSNSIHPLTFTPLSELRKGLF